MSDHILHESKRVRGPRLKQPPYSRELLSARRCRQHINLFLHAGDYAWDRARLRRPPNVLCLSPGDDFAAYDWECVRGLSLVLVVWNRPAEWVDHFARHLIQAGALLVAALGAEYNGQQVVRCQPTFYKPAPARQSRAA